MRTVSGRTMAPKAAFKIKSGWQTLHGRWKPACPVPCRTGEAGTFLLVTAQFTCDSAISSHSYSHSDKKQWCNNFVLKAEEWRKTDFVPGRKKPQTNHTLLLCQHSVSVYFFPFHGGQPRGQALHAPSWPPSPHTHHQPRPPCTGRQISSEGGQPLLLASPAQGSNEGVSHSPCCSNALIAYCSLAVASAR